jgi:antitoxin (DNA-binding transcriptional repressor) of toxin-antitoxin stability system
MIEEEGRSVTVTRRGVPVATIGPVKKAAWKNPMGSWAGRAKIVGDIVYTDMFGVFQNDHKK